MILETLTTTPDAFAIGTGWKIDATGACRGDLCVPLRAGGFDGATGTVDVAAVAAQLGMPIVEAPEAGVSALGPATTSGHALPSADAPELTLPDINGTPFTLSSLRGRKVVMVAWSPY